ncbi:Hypp7586 [Branchiostoma lanceolatum]|uniref:Hypp7586 protein n=1 Tax=Branchiostoma lanceolatum TaxID=7740 RepID=A0A8J9Z255_BRALA|nr:Hypp7586 [Branchiostoma lanceolatum]
MMATASDHTDAPPAGNYMYCSGGQLRMMEIREAASPADRQKWERSPPIPHSMTKEETSHPSMYEALEKITKDNMKEGITEARLDWFTDSELPEDQQALFTGPEACLKLPFTAQVWLPDDSTARVKVTGIIDGQDGVERPGTGFGFEVEYMGQELLLPVDAFVNELASPDDVDGAWLDSPAAVHAKVFAIIRDFYDNAIFTEGSIFFNVWDDVRYGLCNLGQKREMKKCNQAQKKDFLNNPPPIKKMRSFAKMTSEDRLNCVVLPFPLHQMSLAFHTYLSRVAKFPLELKLKYGGGVVMVTGMVPYKADNFFQESRGIYVTVDLPRSEAPPSKKRKNSSPRAVALSVHGVEACAATPDPVRRFLEDISELMEGEDGMCVLRSRFESIHLLPGSFGYELTFNRDTLRDRVRELWERNRQEAAI